MHDAAPRLRDLLAFALASLIMLPMLTNDRSAFGAATEPRGFGAATFGMSVAQVKTVFPKMEQVGGTPEQHGAQTLAVYKVEQQSIYGLKPCEVGLRFFADRLYEVTFDCGRDERVVEALQKHLGDPAKFVSGSAYWGGDKTLIGLNIRVRTFSFADRALSQNVSMMLLKQAMTQQGQPASTPRAPTPGSGGQ